METLKSDWSQFVNIINSLRFISGFKLLAILDGLFFFPTYCFIFIILTQSLILSATYYSQNCTGIYFLSGITDRMLELNFVIVFDVVN